MKNEAKLKGQLEVSMGILVGMITMNIIFNLSKGTSWTETFKDYKIIALMAGILLSCFLYYRKKFKSDLSQ